MRTLAMKFGGASLGTATALTQVLGIIIHESERWDRILIVASALEGVTDMLLEAARQARISNRRGYRRIAATLRTRHLALVDHLPFDDTDRIALKADIDMLLSDMLDKFQKIAGNLNDELSPSMSDALVAVGERLSARIIAALLRQNDIRGVAVDGTELLVTDDVHGNANPIVPLTEQRVSGPARANAGAQNCTRGLWIHRGYRKRGNYDLGSWRHRSHRIRAQRFACSR